MNNIKVERGECAMPRYQSIIHFESALISSCHKLTLNRKTIARSQTRMRTWTNKHIALSLLTSSSTFLLVVFIAASTENTSFCFSSEELIAMRFQQTKRPIDEEQLHRSDGVRPNWQRMKQSAIQWTYRWQKCCAFVCISLNKYANKWKNWNKMSRMYKMKFIWWSLLLLDSDWSLWLHIGGRADIVRSSFARYVRRQRKY